MKRWNTFNELFNEREVLKQLGKVNNLKSSPALSILLLLSEVMHQVFILQDDSYFSLSTLI